MALPVKIFYGISFAFLIFAFIYLGTKNYQLPNKNDNETFTKEFGITQDNVFRYIESKDLLEKMNTESFVVFFGNPENKWSRSYADLLNQTAKYWNVEEIYYYDFWQDRSRNDYYYEHIVEKLSPFLPVFDDDSQDILAPSVLFVLNGEILTYDDETSFMRGKMEPEDYWTRERQDQKQVQLGVLFQEYLGAQNE